MTIIYYFIVVFGVLLLLATGLSWFSTKKTINQTQRESKLTTLLTKIKNLYRLWIFYFTRGNKRKLIPNLLISAAIIFALYLVNFAYFRIDNHIFLLSVITIMILGVWKFGQRQNRKLFEQVFPEVLQILNSASSAGSGLLSAFERCGQDIGGQIGEEFKNIHRRLVLGEDPSSVFDDSYTRYPYKEYYFFIMTIKLNLSKGGQIREVINRLSRVISASKKMEQKKKAMTSEARMSAMIVGCFPVGFFIFMRFAQPENFDFLINNPSGRIVLYGVFGSQLFGFLIIWWLMRRVS
ncbi:type II secretion system F family protein [Avibacterium sp. 20-129]|uniref:type II secretion system F family protein n=1 Tax=Avibacterium sp. 20-129 TaxID=2911525 RepID=UPI002247CC2D|nr:type II secretion system F family protein [Avibacterium sp. 20-129]MCW9698095.1 type II secretion system F family protein [Avibacterium sp. 20-129]